MTIVITGATGRIGVATMALLHQTGAPIHVLTRRLALATDMFGNFAEIHEWHPMSSPPPAAAFRGVEVVINLMGESVAGRWSRRKRDRIVGSRLVGTEKLVHAIRDSRARFVSASSYAIYPGIAGEQYNERTALQAPNNVVQTMIQDWERTALVARRNGNSVAVMRYGRVAGPSEPHQLPLFPGSLARKFQRGTGTVMGDGSRTVPLVDIEDAARMTVWAATVPNVEGPINVVAPVQISFNEIAEKIATSVGRGPRFKVPDWIARRWLGASAIYTLGSFAIEPTVALAGGFRFALPDGDGIVANALVGLAAVPTTGQDPSQA